MGVLRTVVSIVVRSAAPMRHPVRTVVTSIEATQRPEFLNALKEDPTLLSVQPVEWVNPHSICQAFNIGRADKAGMPHRTEDVMAAAAFSDYTLVQLLKAHGILVVNTPVVDRAVRELAAAKPMQVHSDGDGTVVNTIAAMLRANAMHGPIHRINYHTNAAIPTPWTGMVAGTCGGPFGVQVQGNIQKFVGAMVAMYVEEARLGLPGYSTYPGMAEAFNQLIEQGVKTRIVTANSAAGVRAILARNHVAVRDIDSGFDLGLSKTDMFANAAKGNPGCVHVCAGDTLHDARDTHEAAAKTGAPFVSVCVAHEQPILPAIVSAFHFDALADGGKGVAMLPSQLRSGTFATVKTVASQAFEAIHTSGLPPSAAEIARRIWLSLLRRADG